MPVDDNEGYDDDSESVSVATGLESLQSSITGCTGGSDDESDDDDGVSVTTARDDDSVSTARDDESILVHEEPYPEDGSSGFP